MHIIESAALLSRRFPRLLELWKRFKYRRMYRCGSSTWSQEGEDVLIRRLLGRETGFYVDVGAHHPFRYSNTFALHRNGWRGINIDALKEGVALFARHRPNDHNIHAGVGVRSGSFAYYRFDDPAYNTFDKESADEVSSNCLARVVSVDSVRVEPLSTLLAGKLPKAPSLLLLNVDVEGMDLDVLRSNDWSSFRPDIILVEVQQTDVRGLIESPINAYLEGMEYYAFAKLVHTAVFLRKGFLRDRL